MVLHYSPRQKKFRPRNSTNNPIKKHLNSQGFTLPYPINFIINEKYIAWLEQVDVIINTLDTRISYLRKWVNNPCLDLQK